MSGPATLNRELHLEAGDMLLVDKPRGWTSFDVVHKVRRLFRVRKAGHAGTLDPLATGLLILCTGRMTKEIGRFMEEEKEYEVTFRLGGRTASFDLETPVEEVRPVEGITGEMVTAAMASFVGAQEQVPPMYSAAKVGGRRLYRYAQRGLEVPRAPRRIEIRSFSAERVSIPDVTATVVCSKGTYIRALVHDLGQALGCGAYVTDLRRTRIGQYHVRDAASIDALIRFAAGQGAA